jgi:hypothetical protein
MRHTAGKDAVHALNIGAKPDTVGSAMIKPPCHGWGWREAFHGSPCAGPLSLRET